MYTPRRSRAYERLENHTCRHNSDHVRSTPFNNVTACEFSIRQQEIQTFDAQLNVVYFQQLIIILSKI